MVAEAMEHYDISIILNDEKNDVEGANFRCRPPPSDVRHHFSARAGGTGRAAGSSSEADPLAPVGQLVRDETGAKAIAHSETGFESRPGVVAAAVWDSGRSVPRPSLPQPPPPSPALP